MSRSRPVRLLRVLSAATMLSFFALNSLAGENASVTRLDDLKNPAKNLARTNCGATIDLVGPDGRLATITKKDANPNSLLLDDDTLNYPLPEGDTTLLLSFPRTSALDRFTFVNENAAAEGDVTISVSNYRLPAQSAKWNRVNESVAFTGKRLIDLSMLGTEARYVKLSFHATRAG